ncbi:hypothetical protein MRX96_030191 [Rhipicephalus microplus]
MHDGSEGVISTPLLRAARQRADDSSRSCEGAGISRSTAVTRLGRGITESGAHAADVGVTTPCLGLVSLLMCEGPENQPGERS